MVLTGVVAVRKERMKERKKGRKKERKKKKKRKRKRTNKKKKKKKNSGSKGPRSRSGHPPLTLTSNDNNINATR